MALRGKGRSQLRCGRGALCERGASVCRDSERRVAKLG